MIDQTVNDQNIFNEVDCQIGLDISIEKRSRAGSCQNTNTISNTNTNKNFYIQREWPQIGLDISSKRGAGPDHAKIKIQIQKCPFKEGDRQIGLDISIEMRSRAGSKGQNTNLNPNPNTARVIVKLGWTSPSKAKEG